MKKIVYNPEFDFAYYIDVIANIDRYKAHIEKEQKSKAHILDKEFNKRQEQFFKEANEFYMNLSFIQRNSLDLFFHKTDILSDFLMHLMYSDQTIDEISIELFKKFLVKAFEQDTIPTTYEEVYPLVKDHYDAPEVIVDFDKTTNLIIDILKEPRILNDSIKMSIQALYNIFKTEKIDPEQDKIDAILGKHQAIYEKDPDNFLENLTHGQVGPAEAKDPEMKAYFAYFSPFSLFISISKKKYIYGRELANLMPKKNDEDAYEPLLKFLSDSKRYQMIKKLSKKKWYSNELAKEFKITPATMSYHVNKMYQLGLIHLEQGDQNRMYMTLDKERLESLLKKIQKDLLS